MNAITTQFLAVGFYLYVGRTLRTVVINRGRLHIVYLLQGFFHLQSCFVDTLEVRTVDFQSHRSFHTRGEHHLPGSDGLKFGRAGETGKIGRTRDLFPNIVFCSDFLAPLTEIVAMAVGHQTVLRYPFESFFRIVYSAALEDEAALAVGFEPCPMTIEVEHVFGLIVDGGLIHLYGSRIEGTLCPAPFAHSRLYLRNLHQPAVYLPAEPQVLLHSAMRHRRRHEHERALIERRHELAAGMLPYQYSAHQYHSGDGHEGQTMAEAPAENTLIMQYHQPQQGQNQSDKAQDEKHIDEHSILWSQRKPHGSQLVHGNDNDGAY